MEDGVFPGDMARYNEEDMEEERRLCYVAITRAKKELYLSSSRSRLIFGQTRRNPPSTFLSEIDPDLLDETQSPELACSGGGFGARLRQLQHQRARRAQRLLRRVPRLPQQRV